MKDYSDLARREIECSPGSLDAATLDALQIKLSADADWLDKGSLTGFPLISRDCREARDVIIEMRRDQRARNAIDPITRMHNLCDALAEQRNESPYTQEAWELQDDAYRAKCGELANAKATIEALQRDAARYRWIRGNEYWQSAGVVAIFDDGEYSPTQGDELDAAIDAAMKGAL